MSEQHELNDLYNDIAGQQRQQGKPGATPKPNGKHVRPIIRIEPGKISQLATESEDTLIASEMPVFQRGGQLVRPLAWQVAASDERQTLAVGLKPIGVTALVDLLNQAAEFVKGKNNRLVDPPAKVAATILSRSGLWKVPSILGMITAPTLRRDGSVICQPGFDPKSRLFYVPDPTLNVTIIEHPTKEDAAAALTLLDELIVGFKFVGKVDKAVALSGMISPVVRGALGMVPLHGITAPTAGSGKSYYVDVVCVIATGRICPVAAAAEDDPKETEKRLVGLLLAAFPVISLDNLSDPLGGDLLGQAVERPLIRLRALGSSESIEIESRATVFATANNMTVKGDMTRRTMLAQIDTQEERPEDREFQFDPVARVIEDRGKYVSACLTIVRAYIEAGCPDKQRKLASYGPWSDLVRSALIWLGCEDPAKSIGDARATDPVLEGLRQVLAAWELLHGLDAALTVSAVIAGLADRSGELNLAEDDKAAAAEAAATRELRAALMPIAGSRRGLIDPNRLGVWLRKSKGRVVDGKRFTVPAHGHGGAATWAVSKVQPAR
jgi:putative DNA primase/helicase